MTSLILTLIGPDRPGLIDAVAELVREQGGNWLESRMAHLAGNFAGIVRVDVPAEKAAELISRFEDLESQGLTVVTRHGETGDATNDISLVRLELVGNDRPGIVREVTRVLAQHQVNVEEFHTECTDASHSGIKLFQAQATLRMPVDVALSQLQPALEAIALDLMVDIKVASNG